MPTIAYIVRRARDRFEIRESTNTSAGPRARSLATFHVLTDEVLEHAGDRAEKPFDRKRISELAAKLGVPVVGNAVDAAARSLLVQLASGRSPRPGLSQLLIEMLATSRRGLEPASRDSIVEWIGAGTRLRGEALRDLLDLTDRLPVSRKGELRYPPLKRLRREKR